MTTTYIQRPNLAELAKEAMAGTIDKVSLSSEVDHQMGIPSEREKTAEADVPADSIPTEYILKIAGALDHILETEKEAAGVDPGEGATALAVSESNVAGSPPGPGEQGQARQQPPKTPGLQTSGVSGDAATALETNDGMGHPEQPVDPMHNEKTKAAEALLAGNLASLGFGKSASSALVPVASKLVAPAGKAAKKSNLGKYLAGAAGLGAVGAGAAAVAKKKKGEEGEKKASLLASNLEALGIKVAEDAINPAKISGGSTPTGETPPEGASASGEQVPSEPSDVRSQKSLIASNQAAIDYTRAQAKKDPKKDVGHVVAEPALSAATDKTLKQTFSHTGEAGPKIASAKDNLIKAAAAQVLLSKMASDANDKTKAAADAKAKKEKQSSMGGGSGGPGGLASAAGQSGFSANSL